MKNPYKALSKINPQKENGHREINNANFHALMGARLSGAEYQVALMVIDRTWGFGKSDGDHISLSQFENDTRLSRQSVITAIKSLEKKQIIVLERTLTRKGNCYLFNKHSDTWLTSQANHTSSSSQANHTNLVKQTTLLSSQAPHDTQKKGIKKLIKKGKPPVPPLPPIPTGHKFLQELSILQGIPWYSFTLKKDEAHLAELQGDFPGVPLLAVVKDLKAYFADHPITVKSNPRLKLRNFCEGKKKYLAKAGGGPAKGSGPGGLPSTAELKKGWGKT